MTQTNHQPSRRALFRGVAQRLQGQSVERLPIRPPGTLSASQFIDQCERCDACISACPENIIVRGDGGYPELNFNDAGCTACGACIDACEPGALQSDQNRWPLAEWHLDAQCLAKKNVTCQSCKDACDTAAITFPMTSVSPKPTLIADLCTACGECVSVCPVNAITIQPLTQSKRDLAL